MEGLLATESPPMHDTAHAATPPPSTKRRPHWLDDKDVSECLQCKKEFTLLRRKHHCRYCGHIFCGSCSNYSTPIVSMDYLHPVRVCYFCWKLLQDSNEGQNKTKHENDKEKKVEAAGTQKAGSIKDAVLGGDIEAIKKYLKDGHSVQHRNIQGQSLLHVAAFAGQLGVAQFLVENGAEVDAIDDNGNTPLHYAAMFCHTKLVAYLVGVGAQISAVNRKRYTPLHLAIKQQNLKNTELVELLLSLGADVNARNIRDLTPLHLACDYIGGDDTLVKLLMQHNCEKEAKNCDGRTALHIAASSGNLTIVECLVQYGCLLQPRDNMGNTPLHCACEARGDSTILLAHEARLIETIKYLIAQGSDPTAVNDRGEMPLDVCANDSIRNALLQAMGDNQASTKPAVSGADGTVNAGIEFAPS